MRKIFYALIVCTMGLKPGFGQQLQEGEKIWSAEDRLSVDDFKITISDANNDVVFGQFYMNHVAGGFDFMKRNFNQNVTNVFSGNASWIDTTEVVSVEKIIEYQQMQFDLSEIQARKFRKRLLENKGQIAKGMSIVSQINNEITAELSELRLSMARETESGRNEQKVAEWKEKIAAELKALDVFRYENKEKIKLTR